MARCLPAVILAPCRSGCSSGLSLAACDLLTVLQTFPHSVRFDIFPQPPEPTRVTQLLSQTCLCLQFFRKFSQRGWGMGEYLSPPSNVLFLSQYFPQVYLCSTRFLYKVSLYIQMGIVAFLKIGPRSCELVERKLKIPSFIRPLHLVPFFFHNIPCSNLSERLFPHPYL